MPVDLNGIRRQVFVQTLDSFLRLHRAEITAFLLQTQGHKVLSGPFSGMTLLDDVVWGDGDIAPKLLGTYEEELHSAIIKAAGRNASVVVNVGCAEGYFSVGLARLLPNARVFAFDINANAQAICRKAAEANGVGSRVVTAGACSIDALRKLIAQDGRVLLFVDCEGAELELLNPSLLPELRTCDIIVECHDFMNRSITSTLTQRLSSTHKIENIIEGPRDPNRFAFLRPLLATDRWLAVDEKRPETMNWLTCWSQ